MWDGTDNETYSAMPNCPYSCIQDDVMNANDNIKDVASFWAETI
jgi:hypothetical protein